MSERDLSGLSYEDLAVHREHAKKNAVNGREIYERGTGLPRIRGFGLFIRTKAVIDLDRVEQVKENKKKKTSR